MACEQVFLVGDLMSYPLETFDGFDCLITDPPYSAHVHENATSAGTMGEGSVGWHKRDLGFDPLDPRTRIRIAEIARRMRRWSIVFSDYEGIHHWMLDVTRNGLGPARHVRCFPWVRWSQPQKSGDRPGSHSEVVLFFHAAERMHFNASGARTHFDAKCLRAGGQTEKHPTEKPLDLMLEIVSGYSDPGNSVLDVCAGAGTTALACKLLGRDCVAVDKDAQWAARGETRLANPWGIKRDRDRAESWCVATHEEASSVPAPKAADGSDVRTWERAQRRLADVQRVAQWL